METIVRNANENGDFAIEMLLLNGEDSGLAGMFGRESHQPLSIGLLTRYLLLRKL